MNGVKSVLGFSFSNKPVNISIEAHASGDWPSYCSHCKEDDEGQPPIMLPISGFTSHCSQLSQGSVNRSACSILSVAAAVSHTVE